MAVYKWIVAPKLTSTPPFQLPSRVDQSEQSVNGGRIGTPHFMSPEVCSPSSAAYIPSHDNIQTFSSYLFLNLPSLGSIT